MRCPACGATNPDSASWCGQCYASLRAEKPAAQPASAAAAPVAVPPPPQAPQASEGPQQSAVAAADEGDGVVRDGFRRRGELVEWQCVRCDQFNSMDALTCDVCGSSFSARYERDEPEPERNWSAALALSAVLPGAGHISVGRIGTGIARCTLFVAFLLPALPIMFGARTGGATIAITPLLMGVLILWGGSIADIRQLQRGDKEILNGRALLWLTVGVLLLSLVGLAAAVMMARGQSG